MQQRPTVYTDSEPSASFAQPAGSAVARVLVIDDDLSICRLASRILSDSGYHVTTCTDSTRVLPLLKEISYQCVLLDIRLGGLEGTDLLPIIKRYYANLPVIIVSAYCDQTDAGYLSSLGAFKVVAKPFDNDLLVDVVNRAVGTTETIPLVLTSLSLNEARDQVYRKLIVAALRRSGWNQIKAARLLGISRYSLIRWLRKLEIDY